MNKNIVSIVAMCMIAIGFLFLVTAFASNIPSWNEHENDELPDEHEENIVGDFDGDGTLTEADRSELFSNYSNNPATANTYYDLNNDGLVDIYDCILWDNLYYQQQIGGGGGGGGSDSDGGGGAIGGAHPLSILPFGGDWIVSFGLIGCGVFLLWWKH